MRYIKSIQMIGGSNEELFPDLSDCFPYSATNACLEPFADPAVPWHWHPAVELFVIEEGTLEYTTPYGKKVFPAGSGGILNANVLHSTRVLSEGPVKQLLHHFEPRFIAGEAGSRIDTVYVSPLIQSGPDMLELTPDRPDDGAVIGMIREAFMLESMDVGYEIRLRSALSEIWVELFRRAEKNGMRDTDEKLKEALLYIRAHSDEYITVERLAAAVHISKRVCYRLFREKLHTTPIACLIDTRIRRACRMLISTDAPVTEIAGECGFDSGSYFGKVFRETFGVSPTQYRKKWHDSDKKGHDTNS